MTEARIDRRAARTRGLLHKALADLLPEQAYDAITVDAICAEAGVGRSTFYAHFTGKDDLKRHALTPLGAMLTRAAGASDKGVDRPPFAFTEAFFEHAASHLSQLCVQAGGRRAEVSVARVRQLVTAQVRAELARIGSEPSLSGARVAFLVSGLMGLFEWWLDDGAVRSPLEMAGLFRELAAGDCKD